MTWETENFGQPMVLQCHKLLFVRHYSQIVTRALFMESVDDDLWPDDVKGFSVHWGWPYAPENHGCVHGGLCWVERFFSLIGFP